MLQTIADFAREQLDASGAAAEVAARHARRYAIVAREIRDGVEGTEQVAAIARGILEDDNFQAALDTFLAAARGGDEEALEQRAPDVGRPLDVLAHPRQEPHRARQRGRVPRAGSRPPAELGPRGRSDHRGPGLVDGRRRSSARLREWDDAYDTAAAVGAEHERCVAAMARSLAFMTRDPHDGNRLGP